MSNWEKDFISNERNEKSLFTFWRWEEEGDSIRKWEETGSREMVRVGLSGRAEHLPRMYGDMDKTLRTLKMNENGEKQKEGKNKNRETQAWKTMQN